MGISDRINDWVEDRTAVWGGRLGTFLGGVIEGGMEKFSTGLEPGIIDLMKPSLERIKANPQIPQDIKDAIDKSTGTGNIGQVASGLLWTVIGWIGVILGGNAAISRLVEYETDWVQRSRRIDPVSAITAWRRDPAKYEKYLDDLKYQGWSDDRIEALKFVTLYYPGPADLVRWQAREVFEPDMVSKYGLDDEYGNIQKEPFYKAGMTDEQILNYWRAHWEHASWLQVVEMLRRQLITEDDIWEWFRLVEIVPYWRDKLIQTSWNVPTRVDVRRFWDMRTIDEARLREIYTAQGYHGKDLDDYVLWTKVYVAFPDLMTRYKNGWLTLDGVKQELTSLGMPPDRVEEMIQTKVKAQASENLSSDRDLTMSQIVKGVKKAVITRAEGSQLLQDMGYDPYEAEFILAIEIPEDEVVTTVQLRELTKSDILKGLKEGVIFRDEALAKLLQLRYTAADAEFLLKIYDAQVAPPEEIKDKEASKADIVTAVKKGLITPETAYLMLQDIGYTPEASEFILMVHAEESPFSPQNYAEFQDITSKFRVAAGLQEEPMPEELKKAADELVQVTGEVEALKQSIFEENRLLIDQDVIPAENQARLTDLQVKLHRAEAELDRVKSNYNKLAAEWKQTVK